MGVLGHGTHAKHKNKASRGNLWGLRTYFETYGRGNFPGHHVLGCLSKSDVDGCEWVQSDLDGCVQTHRQGGNEKQGKKSPKWARRSRFGKHTYAKIKQGGGNDGYRVRVGEFIGIWV